MTTGGGVSLGDGSTLGVEGCHCGGGCRWGVLRAGVSLRVVGCQWWQSFDAFSPAPSTSWFGTL